MTSYWNTNGVSWSEARVAVYTAGVEEAHVRFTAAGSTHWTTGSAKADVFAVFVR